MYGRVQASVETLAAVLDDLGDAVVAVDEDDAADVPIRLVVVVVAEGQDDDLVPHLGQAGGGTR